MAGEELVGRASPGRRALLIAGPTASGKSALALALADRLGGTLINADSMQVYADLAILTARPSAAESKRVPHRLFGHVDATEPYSVGRWVKEAASALEAAWSDGRVPILVGGTGLYLRALTEGLSAIPAVPDAVRAAVRADAEGCRPEALHAKLAAVDPVMAGRLRPSDPQRIIRALEVFAATGQSLATFQTRREVPVLPSESVVGVVLALDRGELNRRIDARFDAMMAASALDEVARLAARRLDPSLPAMRALGVPPLLRHLAGELPLADAVAQGKLLTRHYAKRQLTFFRHQLPDLPWVAPADADRVLVEGLASPPLSLPCEAGEGGTPKA